MKNKIKRRIIAGLMLAVFGISNSGMMALAANDFTDYGYLRGMDSSRSNGPVIRNDGTSDHIKLTGDVTITTKKAPVTLSLRDSDVTQVLRMFADKAGYNIIFFSDDIKDKVTMDLVNVPLNSAFEMVMEKAKLTYAVKDRTLIVAKASDDSFNLTRQEISLIPVKYVSASPIAEFLNKNIYAMSRLGSSGKDIAITNPTTNEIMIFGTKQDVQVAQKVISEFDKKPLTTTFKVNHTTPAEMAGMICDMLVPAIQGSSSSDSASSGSGASAGASDASASGGSGAAASSGSDNGASSGSSAKGSATGGAAGIVTGFASSSSSSSGSSGSSSSSSSSSSSGSSSSNTESSASLKVGGGTIACTMNSATSAGNLSSLGLQNLSIAYFSQLGTISVIGGSASQVETIKDFVSQMDKKQPQAYLEVSIIELSEDGSKTLNNMWQFNSGFLSATFNDGATGTSTQYPIFFKGNQGYYLTDGTWDDTKNAYTTTGYVGPWTGPRTLTWAINYVLENKKGRTVANPRILITNGQESVIDLTSDYVQSTDSEMTASGTGNFATRTYNIANDNGIKVSITPFISPDGYVTLNIKPEYATIKSQETAVDQYKNTYIAATLLQRRNLDLKNIRIKDGETLVIGGMIQEVETKTVKKVPGLGDLPVIGTAFRSSATSKTKEEMLIMLTPKIITDTEDAASVKNAL
ncbi:MAG: hypothetical protein LKG27_06750 [Clostridiaceae bacterium]|jgi:type II secretory pathway component GspD/PulD (secretin)|nr:hypothetical protein [Clostridiaceae bacterium]